MNVVHVVPSIAEEAQGPSYSVPALCKALADQQVQVTLHVLEPAPALGEGQFAVEVHPAWPILTRLGISPRMKRALRQAAARADIMHNHSLWMMPNVYPAQAVRGTKCRLILSPRGTVSDWALRRSRWQKRVMWWLCQSRALHDAICFHATSEEECAGIRRLGGRGPVAVIPNGIDIPSPSPRTPDAATRKRLLFLGRIHPTKGVDVLLKSWREVQDKAPDWELHVVGPDNGGHLKAMRSLAQHLGAERVSFPGPVYGEQRAAAYRKADLFVLPTHSENFGMTVAEALAHGVPAIVSRGAPWSGLEENRCGWWIDIGQGPLTECLREALQVSRDDLHGRGMRGRQWMARDFSWAGVAKMMRETYQWLLGGGTPPPCIRNNS